MRYEDSIRQIKGVGEKAEQRFHKLDIWNVGDLLEHYPREYDEFHDLVKIADIKEGEMAAVEGVMACRPSIHTTARLKILSMVLEDETGRITVTWFNMPFLANRLNTAIRIQNGEEEYSARESWPQKRKTCTRTAENV